MNLGGRDTNICATLKPLDGHTIRGIHDQLH
jgi:hypothetical protein